MRSYNCRICGGEIYLAVRDESTTDAVLRVDVTPCPDGDIALAVRKVGPDEGTMLEGDELVVFRKIAQGEPYTGPRRKAHKCPVVRPDPEKCRSCDAPVYWGVTTAGKRIPVDADPIPTGNMALDFQTAGVLARILGRNEKHEGPRYQSHFVTCPNASKHRRKRCR